VLFCHSVRRAWLAIPLIPALALARGALAEAAPLTAERTELVRVGDAVFTLVYGPGDDEAARQVEAGLTQAARAAQRWAPLSAPVTITIHATHELLESATHRAGYGWMRAWARYAAVDLQSPRTWSGGRASDAQVAELLTHELTHCAMYQAARRQGPRGRRIPLWFREGMASVTAGEPLPAGPAGLAETAAALGVEPAHDAGTVDRQYQAAGEVFRLLVARYGEDRIRRLLCALGAGLGFAEAFRAQIGVSLSEFEEAVLQRAGAAGSRPAAPSSSEASSELKVTPSPMATSVSALPSAVSGRSSFSQPPRSSATRV
jgi:hypothetical protein